jgi:ComF family protein
LAKKRQRQRGYNQSLEIARGISEITNLPIYNKVVRRNVFEGSQTNKGRWERNENVEKVFEMTDETAIHGKHLLIIDDVVTTGATVIACAKELCKAGNVKISVLSLGFAKN